MRRYFILLILLFTISIVAIVSAQEENPELEIQRPLLVDTPPTLTIAADDGDSSPITLDPIDIADLPFKPNSPTADPASDTCEAAVPISIPGGGTTDVKNFTNHSDFTIDPNLSSCMWGTPSNPYGWRTAWYQFKPNRNGSITISTKSSSYDTVLSVYTGACLSILHQVACNDDENGFTSEVQLQIQKDVTYYIEVADWQSGVSTPQATLNVNITKNPFLSAWDLQSGQMPQPTSRHATAVVGNNIYVIGGQTSAGDITRGTYRFNADTKQWTTLQSMLGTGYANTTAAYLDDADDGYGKIYLPSGYDGNSSLFGGAHQVYDIDTNSWAFPASQPPQAPWTVGRPTIYAQAVAQPDRQGYYLTGGINRSLSDEFLDNTSTRADVFFYSASTNSWTTKAPMTYARYAHVANWVNGRLCVAGGLKYEEGTGLILHSNVECYNANADTWSVMGSMKIARYNAGSAVGRDGKWYVFGGITVDSRGTVAAQSTEIYNPATNTWTILPVPYDLGGYDNSLTSFPFREWPRGGRIGNQIWAIGGNVPVNGIALGYIETLNIFPRNLYLPLITNAFGTEDGTTMDSAWSIVFGQTQTRAFIDPTDSQRFYHMYAFNVTAPRQVTLSLTDMPFNSDLDMYLYSSNKLLLGRDEQVGNNNETIQMNLPNGRYYILIKRTSPPQALLESIYYNLSLQ